MPARYRRAMFWGHVLGVIPTGRFYLLPPVVQIFGWSVYRINPANGIFDFRVGGTLHVNANQAPGDYQGNFNVRIEYY